MGFFGFYTSDDEKRKEEVRTGARAPDRTERKQCWDARDSYFRCLDSQNVIDALGPTGRKQAEKHCAAEGRAFDQNCAAAWVTYFKKSRVAEFKKKATLQRIEREQAGKVAVRGPGDAPAATR
ncbi:cytochrome oxidase c subunit VIb-domain-containing protein [Camillea tinctor]|nr:cytochrome oxidase c subunit VIb-domain-containing protein [Camillea tinctor]